ncbi:HEAT repeat domain-containing protein [Williamsia sp. CHRR-6]|uniref:HEAT repeat domain-containing protein n=1 Tax=Williamsia sp. CHRR-6 TaxID=2835871 RepID=UPI001BD9993C|nr:HEAT repeat domain-containing protein [Williamsia sp. CHRR-6]MBT0567097.1 HEAT repeat domain-containing protein [Williamsia sp. CHRR-6]
MMFVYPGMPEGDDWLAEEMSSRPMLRDGVDAFEVRLVRDLEAVGVRAVKVSDLNRAVRSVPPAIPVFVDWLKNLDVKVPGPETRHRAALRRVLLEALDDPACRGNREVVDVLFEQLERRSPPLAAPDQIWTAENLAHIAQARDFDRFVRLIERSDVEDGTLVAIARYVGRYKRPQSREIALQILGNDIARPDAIRALAKVGEPGDVEVIAQYVDDPNPDTRRAVVKAVKKLTP